MPNCEVISQSCSVWHICIAFTDRHLIFDEVSCLDWCKWLGSQSDPSKKLIYTVQFSIGYYHRLDLTAMAHIIWSATDIHLKGVVVPTNIVFQHCRWDIDSMYLATRFMLPNLSNGLPCAFFPIKIASDVCCLLFFITPLWCFEPGVSMTSLSLTTQGTDQPGGREMSSYKQMETLIRAPSNDCLRTGSESMNDSSKWGEYLKQLKGGMNSILSMLWFTDDTVN